jgi:hypothetical protein
MEEMGHLCFYDLGLGQCHAIEIIEHAPTIFSELRRKYGISDDFLFQSFVPLHNIQAIHNFFTGTGKSSSFFFFSDNKAFVLKTLKESERKLLFDQNILENYFEYLQSHETSLLSKMYGIFTLKFKNMEDIHCFIMDNLLGKDFNNIERIYDLKGSTKGRKAKLS